LVGVVALASCSSGDGEVVATASVVAADHCPSITSAVAAPLQTTVGGAVAVWAEGSDADTGDLLSYQWTPAANFDHPTAPRATFTCTIPGPQSIKLLVSDNHPVDPCSTTFTARITCVR
jgi:hypothetical protein